MRATALSVCLALAPVSALAQTTPWGDPDLQGVWSTQTPVPLERPAALANKPTFTKQEAADVEKKITKDTKMNKFERHSARFAHFNGH